MSSFICEFCGMTCIDSDKGYVTGCKHYPAEVKPGSFQAHFVAIRAAAGGDIYLKRAIEEMERKEGKSVK